VDGQPEPVGSAPPSSPTPLEIPGSGHRVWVVRAGPGAVFAASFLSQNLIAIGWEGVGSAASLSWEELSERMRKAMPADSPVTVGLASGVVYRLANDMQFGDLVITPEPGGTLLIGEVDGPYEFRAEAPVEDYRHVRRVRWFDRVQRATLSKEIRNSLGAIITLFVPGHQAELLATLMPRRQQGAVGSLSIGGVLSEGTQAGREVMPGEPIDPPSPPNSQFETDKSDLLYILDQIGNRDLALPDFQRSFVWDSGATRELIVSIIRGFPAGNLLFLRGGSKAFLPRAVEEAPPLDGHEPSALVLDGQQRLSSLYQAFAGVGAHRFFIDIPALMRGNDIDDVVTALPSRRARAYETIEAQARSLTFPLSRVRDFAYWRDDILDARASTGDAATKELRSYLNKVESSVIAPIRSYQFPVTTLSSKTLTEAVCTIFETLNRTGIKLSVFELICARAFAEGHRLRDSWHQTLEDHQILQDFDIDPYYILQTVALRIGKKPQRGVVVELPVVTIIAEWDASVRSMASALIMLRDECGVLTKQWLPYAPMLPTLAAAWRDVDSAVGAIAGARRLKLQRWFWCACFAGDYNSAPNSRADADVPLLHSWLCGGQAPHVVQEFSFEPTTWLGVTVRQRGLYRSAMALLLSRHPLDFHQAIPLTRSVIETTAVEDHHVFPVAFLREQGMTSYADTVLNHTLIDKITNASIGKSAPSGYLTRMESELGTAMSAVLASHGLPAQPDGPLLTDDYDGFLEWRRGYLAKELLRVTTEEVAASEVPRLTLVELLGAGESVAVEFKSSARWNLHTQLRDERLEKRIVVAIAAFMNADGGTLLIGVDDDGEPVGLDGDLSLMKKPDVDRYQLWLVDLLEATLGKPAATNAVVSFGKLQGRDVCRVNVRRAGVPVFLHAPKSTVDEFYVRIGNSSRQLSIQEFDMYRRERWG
jgi:hypothetical protein